jgi:UDP-4-amino-4,6-dideoxy-N-acetyl-beta-L-altrosamine transaminase
MLALYGGKPVRKTLLCYGKQTIEDDDIKVVTDVLRDNTYLTTGPKVEEFENCVAKYTGIRYACAVNSGTAALHMAMSSLDLKYGDEVIVTSMSFVATANAILYCNAKPIFCDILHDTMNIDHNQIESLITTKTRAIIVVDFAGQLCHYKSIKSICTNHNLYLIEDASHSLGCKGMGEMSDLTTLSFHPVKNITTCEGGMVLTNNTELYNKMRNFGKHGINRDHKERNKTNSHFYEMEYLGYNFRIPDLLCALGINQMKKLDRFINDRNNIAEYYREKLSKLQNYLTPLTQRNSSVFHIYVIRLNLKKLSWNRDKIYDALIKEGIGVNVHYIPIHMHPFYVKNQSTFIGMMPIAEMVYKDILTLPIYPTMKYTDVDDVVSALTKVINHVKL